MSGIPSLATLRGRTIGTILLVAAQITIGLTHVFFGVWLVFGELSFTVYGGLTLVYSFYTLAFGMATLICTYGIWLGNRWGWLGTVGVCLFVIVADGFTLLNLPSVPGIPKSAGAAEIVYSLAVLLYLFQKQVRSKYRF